MLVLQVVCEVSMTVNVLDVNDNAPQFNETSYHFTVPDNAAHNTLVGTVQVNTTEQTFYVWRLVDKYILQQTIQNNYIHVTAYSYNQSTMEIYFNKQLRIH